MNFYKLPSEVQNELIRRYRAMYNDPYHSNRFYAYMNGVVDSLSIEIEDEIDIYIYLQARIR